MGGHRGSFVGSVAIVALVVGLASGCTGAQGASGPDASPSRSAPTSATPTASSTPSATLDDEARARIPKAARAHTAKGAEAFARFYLEQVNKAWMAPDPELIRPYALESCKTCANYLKTSTWLEQHRFRYDGSPMRLGDTVLAPESKRDHVFIELAASQEQRKIVDESGAVQEALPHQSAGAQVELNWSNDTWVVREVRVIL